MRDTLADLQEKLRTQYVEQNTAEMNLSRICERLTEIQENYGRTNREQENLQKQISEISESRVVVAGNTALVGVKFASAYQGEMTERIREMIAGVVREADPSIQTVAVTAEAGDVDAVYGFAEQIQSGKNGDSLAEDINRIVRNITTMR